MKPTSFSFLLAALLFASCQQQPVTDPAAEAALTKEQLEVQAIDAVRQFYNFWNDGKLDDCAKLIAADAIDHMGDQNVVGADNIMAAVRAFAAAFPDSHFEIEKITATGDLVMAYGTWSGTQQGDFSGFKATNKMYSIKDVDMLRVNAEGKLTEHWAVQEGCAMAGQLGWVMPTGTN